MVTEPSLVRPLVSFVRSIAVPALPADQQRQWLNSLGLPGTAGIADELALEFNDGIRLLPQFVEHGWIPSQAAARLGELDAVLEAMSGAENAALWQVPVLDTADEWADIRTRATAILCEL